MKLLDLFSGIGGFSLGLERAGFQTVAFCEIDDYACKVLNKHWPNVPIYRDIRELTYDRLRADGISRIDVITGGFPCQDISLAGKQAGIEGDRSGLWAELARLISEIRPKYAIVENVTALLSGERGRWFQRVLGDLAEIGYGCEWHCIPASAVGMAHFRDRAWVLAYSTSKRRTGILYNFLAKREEQAAQFKAIALDTSRNYRKRARGEMDGEPQIFRGNDGIPRRVDRLRCLGNAVVPQIPELIGRAIMEYENEN